MKRFISLLISFIIGISIYSCAVSNPSWTDNSSERVLIESYRDTITFDRLYNTLKYHDIHPTMDEWTTIRYYTPDGDEVIQFIYTKKDTTFIINKTNDNEYIFYKEMWMLK